jgi:hypothetical protein
MSSEKDKFYRQDNKRKLKNCSFMCFALQDPQGRRWQQQHFECVVGFLLGAPNKVVSTETYPSLYELHEYQWEKICMIYINRVGVLYTSLQTDNY